MHKHILLPFFFLFAGIILFAPSMLRADIAPPEGEPSTFENLQKFTLDIYVEGEQFAPNLIEAGNTYEIRYALWFSPLFVRDFGDVTPGHEAEVFQRALEDHKLFLELWRGEPLTPGASVAQRWELPPNANGTVRMTFPDSASYFLVAYTTSEVRDEAAYCIRYEVPQEYCEEDGYFSHFAPEEVQRYFKGDSEDAIGLHDSNPTAFGGLRIGVDIPRVSSVLFLPGIKGSRLYDAESKLWEPSGSDDVRQLFLDESGKSVNANVHAQAGDVLASTLGQNFYASFFNDLDAIEASGEFGNGWTWETAAYDWRLSLNDLITKGARYDDRIYYNEASGMPYIERALRDLAATSPTGKVSIVAHSNGGLVAKALMQRLGNAAGSALVDKVILVGVPQSGAPRALAAALFGYGEALPLDECADSIAHALCEVLVDRATAREFAEHSPMTYHLLPSQAYFTATNDLGHPPAMFQGQTFYESERSRYQTGLNSADELYDFALARDGGRTKPAADDTGRANVLSEYLIEYARTIHALLDTWSPPQGVEVYQVAGWGRQTFSGIQFYEEPRFLDLFGKPVPRYRPAFTENGDGVVPDASALMMEDTSLVKRYWVDLTRVDESHASILEIGDVRAFVRSLLVNSGLMPPLISASTPERAAVRTILFVLHSPLTLGITDADGKYTGALEDGSVKAEIPGVEYGKLGETQYLIAPAGQPYEVVLKGLAKGTFSLDILEKLRDDVSTTTVMGNIPATADTVATLTLPAITGDISDLQVDTDGDGTVDRTVTPKLGETVVLETVAEELPDDPEPTEPPATEIPPKPDAPSRSGSNHSQLPAAPSVETTPSAPPTEMVTANTPMPPDVATTAEERPSPRLETESVAGVPPRTLTASAYDAFGSAVHTLVLRILVLLLLLILAALMLWRALRAKRNNRN